MKLVEAVEFIYIAHSLGSGSGVHSGAGPSFIGKPNLLWWRHKTPTLPLLQLLLLSAGSQHVAFRNLCESQSRSWAFAHQRENQRTLSSQIWPVFTKITLRKLHQNLQNYIVWNHSVAWSYVAQKQAAGGPSGWGIEPRQPVKKHSIIKWFKNWYFKLKKLHIVALRTAEYCSFIFVTRSSD